MLPHFSDGGEKYFSFVGCVSYAPCNRVWAKSPVPCTNAIMQCSCFTSKNCLLMPHGAYWHSRAQTCKWGFLWSMSAISPHKCLTWSAVRIKLGSVKCESTVCIIIQKLFPDNLKITKLPKKSNHKVISAKNIHTTRCYRQLMHQLHKSLSVKLQQADILHHAK